MINQNQLRVKKYIINTILNQIINFNDNKRQVSKKLTAEEICEFRQKNGACSNCGSDGPFYKFLFSGMIVCFDCLYGYQSCHKLRLIIPDTR